MSLNLTGGGGGAGIRCIDLADRSRCPSTVARHVIIPLSSRTTRHVVGASKKVSKTGRFDSKKKRSLVTTTKEQSEELRDGGGYDERPPFVIEDDGSRMAESGFVGDGKAPPISLSELPGLETDFWEGSNWDAFGFFVQYLWAFGIVFALISGGIAVSTYNEGATDFKETPVYKEAIQSRDLLDEAEGSNSEEVFESNPTEVAPSLE